MRFYFTTFFYRAQCRFLLWTPPIVGVTMKYNEMGQKVKKGDLLISFDMEAVKAAGYLCTTPMIICNTEDYQSVSPVAEGEIQAGTDLLEVKG